MRIKNCVVKLLLFYSLTEKQIHIPFRLEATVDYALKSQCLTSAHLSACPRGVGPITTTLLIRIIQPRWGNTL